MTELLDPYHFEFFRNGLMVATIAGALCGLIGVYVVLKGMSYIGHGLSHAIFGGFAASALLACSVVLALSKGGRASPQPISFVTMNRMDETGPRFNLGQLRCGVQRRLCQHTRSDVCR